VGIWKGLLGSGQSGPFDQVAFAEAVATGREWARHKAAVEKKLTDQIALGATWE
jgi:hypothetical protein